MFMVGIMTHNSWMCTFLVEIECSRRSVNDKCRIEDRNKKRIKLFCKSNEDLLSMDMTESKFPDISSELIKSANFEWIN